MDDLAKLQYLSLVSKVCAELDAHLGVSDKTLAEFIIDLAQKHPELGAFRAALDENGAEFPASFASNLLALVAKMMPKKMDVDRDEKLAQVVPMPPGRAPQPASVPQQFSTGAAGSSGMMPPPRPSQRSARSTARRTARSRSSRPRCCTAAARAALGLSRRAEGWGERSARGSIGGAQ